MSVCQVRTANANDTVAVRRLLALLGYDNLDLEAFSATYSLMLQDPAITILVAQDEQLGMVGLAAVSHRPQLRLAGVIVSLDELIVADEVRGRGVGGMLLDAVKSLSEQLGAARLELQTNRNRESYRRAFYTKRGFKEVNSAVLRIDYNHQR